MYASFVICFHTARFDNLLQTLRFLVKDHRNVVEQSQLITVCQDTIEFLPEELKSQFHHLIGVFERSDHFDLTVDEMRLPKLTNFGVMKSHSNKVIILESDRILPAGYFSSVIDELGPKVSITCKNMRKLSKEETDEAIISGNYEFKEEYRDENNQIGMRNMWSGNTAIWKPDFIEADLMDELYVGYGWADSDMTNRMANIGVKSIFRPELELHLWHPPHTYGTQNQKRLFLNNGLRFCRVWNIDIPGWLRDEIQQGNITLL